MRLKVLMRLMLRRALTTLHRGSTLLGSLEVRARVHYSYHFPPNLLKLLLSHFRIYNDKQLPLNNDQVMRLAHSRRERLSMSIWLVAGGQ